MQEIGEKKGELGGKREGEGEQKPQCHRLQPSYDCQGFYNYVKDSLDGNLLLSWKFNKPPKPLEMNATTTHCSLNNSASSSAIQQGLNSIII